MSELAGPRALVCPGGANHGAYQAGVLFGLAERLGVNEGEPLPYDIVAGASSGAINAYFVSTAQYQRLADFWHELPHRAAALRRPEFRATSEAARAPRSLRERAMALGVRAAGAAWVFLGLVTRLEGIFGIDAVEDIIGRYTAGAPPLRIPLFVSATNLTRQNPEIFRFRIPTDGHPGRESAIDAALASARIPPVRELPPNAIGRALLASCAMPIVFRPVRVEVDSAANTDEYADGGVVDNAPFDVPLQFARTVDLIITDPVAYYADHREQYRDAVDVGIGTYAAMQRRVLWFQVQHLRDADVTLRVIAPEATLPGRYLDFFDVRAFAESFALGRADGARDFSIRSLS